MLVGIHMEQLRSRRARAPPCAHGIKLKVIHTFALAYVRILYGISEVDMY